MDKREGDLYHDFPSTLFFSQRENISWGELFNVSENFWYENVLWLRGGKKQNEILLSEIVNVSEIVKKCETEEIRTRT